MTILSPTGIPAGAGDFSWPGRLAALELPWGNEDVLAGLTPGAGVFTPSFDLAGRNRLRLDVKNLHDAVLYVWASISRNEQNGSWHKIATPVADTTALPAEFVGYWNLLRLEYVSSPTGANAAVTPRIDLLAVRDPNLTASTVI